MKKYKPKLLIVDDEKVSREGLERALYLDYKVFLSESAETALKILSVEAIDLLLTDVKMAKMSGLDLLGEVGRLYPDITSLVMTAYGSIETAVEAMKKGAYDFVTKPIDLDHLFKSLSQAYESRKKYSSQKSAVVDGEGTLGEPRMLSSSPKVKKIISLIEQVAPSRANILLTGESGTGKEVFCSLYSWSE